MNQDTQALLEAIDLSRLSLSLFILGVIFVLSQVIKGLGGRTSREFPQWRLRIEQTVTVLNFVFVVGGLAMAIFLLFRSKEAAVAIAGSLGLAFAFGAKDLAASFLAGLIIIFDRPFQVGDRIRFGDTYGDVMSIGVRSTRIRTLDDSMVSVPNSQFMNQSVSSANAGALDMQVEIDLYVALGADLRIVEKIVREAAVSSRLTYLEKPIVILFKDMVIERNLLTRVRLKAYVIQTGYEKAFESDIIKRLHFVFPQYLRPEDYFLKTT